MSRSAWDRAKHVSIAALVLSAVLSLLYFATSRIHPLILAAALGLLFGATLALVLAGYFYRTKPPSA
jgi:hypothetical protein